MLMQDVNKGKAYELDMTNFKSSSTLKQLARKQLTGKYSTVILAYFLMQLIVFLVLNFASSQATSSTVGTILYYAIYFIVLLFTGIFVVGQNYLYLQISRENRCTVSDMWYGFYNFPDKAIVIQFVMYGLSLVCGIPFFLTVIWFSSTRQMVLLIFCALTLILFVVASICISLLFSQALYLIIDFPEKTGKELIRLSISLMKGHLARLFYLRVSFLGMQFLVMLTLGIGALWVNPYMNMVYANFYEDLTKGLRRPSIDLTV